MKLIVPCLSDVGRNSCPVAEFCGTVGSRRGLGLTDGEILDVVPAAAAPPLAAVVALLLFDGPLGCRPGLEAAVRYRLTALHREAVRALG
jgi:hypothetical protein